MLLLFSLVTLLAMTMTLVLLLLRRIKEVESAISGLNNENKSQRARITKLEQHLVLFNQENNKLAALIREQHANQNNRRGNEWEHVEDNLSFPEYLEG